MKWVIEAFDAESSFGLLADGMKSFSVEMTYIDFSHDLTVQELW